MAVEQLNFQGINRVVSDYGNAGACEELINLRPTGTGLAPVKPFVVQMAGVTYDKLYIHKAGAVTNYIAVKLDNGTLYIYRVSEAGAIIDTIAQIDVTGKTNFSVDHVHFAYTGNIILFSICDKADNFYKNLSFLWDSTQYILQEADIPQLVLSVKPDSVLRSQNVYTASVYVKEACREGVNQIISTNKDCCFGYFILAVVFKTKDGNTLVTGNWTFFDPVPTLKTMTSAHFDADGHFLDLAAVLPEQTDYNVVFLGFKTSVELSLLSSINEDTSQLKSVEIYVSKQVPYVNFDSVQPQGTDRIFMADLLDYKDAELDNQLLYLQKSVPIGDLIGRETPYEFELTFGGSAQAAAATLEVDAGSVTRFGKILAYNSRYHFFNSEKKVEIGMPSFFSGYTSEVIQHDVFVVYNDGKRDITAYVGVEDLHPEGEEVVIAPFTSIKRVITQRLQSGALYVTRQYEMEESQRYNYSICTNGGSVYTRSRITGAVTGPIYIDEPEAINVTEQYNPFVFKVEHSYLAPGSVLDIQPQMVAVKDVTYGDYPLNVFTNRGLYALLQGNGTVLYGNFKSISNLITSANAVPTEIGTFFIAAGNLWLVAGDNATLISDALNPGPHKFIRDSAGYQAIAAGQYDVSELVSQVPFDEYVNGATLAYNRYRDELFVSNPDYNYTYVLSLKHRQWFKMSLTLSQDVVGSDVATVPIGSVKNIVDFTEELETVDDAPVSVLVHYQTRPFSIGYQYIHVHRLLSMIRANLSTDDLLIVGLYGSDNLQDWKLLSYASRSGIKISQIRTPSAARSWRYYTVCVGGYCPWDTDFGTVLFDYQPVVRRIG